ncbi:MAG: hypothetical protein AB1726_12565 [Planctomycetota bacterium]
MPAHPVAMRHSCSSLLCRLFPLAGLLLAGFLAGPALAQGSRPDQVMWKNPRGDIKVDSGTVTENSLQRTLVETPGGPRERKSDLVERVIFGDVPTTFLDGTGYFDRGDFANAAAKFKLAAGDANARPVVQAHARLRAAQALMRQGAVDPGAFAQARAEAETFLADFPANREVPAARLLQARATRLGGNDKGAAELYRSLFMEGAGGTPTGGYDLADCHQAGLAAAAAFLAAGETAQAQEIYGTMNAALPEVLARLDAESPDRRIFLGLQSLARLGEGQVLLATGKAGQAKTFFDGQIKNADINNPDLVYGAHLGLAESMLAEGNHREAQLEFAFVSALDHVSRDRVARALVGLAQCADSLHDSTSAADAKAWLQDVCAHYGDTPAVLRAQEMLQGR